MNRLYVYGSVAILTLAMAGLATHYRDKYRDQKKVTQAVEQALITYSGNVQDEISEYNTNINILRGAYVDAEVEKDEIERKFAGHDFGLLFERKPKMVINRVNGATKLLFDLLEQASAGSPEIDQPTPAITTNDEAGDI